MKAFFRGRRRKTLRLSDLKARMTRDQAIQCPHCRHSGGRSDHAIIIENRLRILAGIVFVAVLVPLAVIAWKFFSDSLSDCVSHSIITHPLGDWTHYY